ncbi:MAG TPA: serine/threonine-protein kinase [Ktedonobacteraceae bacterium]|nr:serine/threonine-protein kinase [Ktedonobacteraceae bacterium]
MQRFGNYDLIRRLAVGGMGEVYLAKQRTAFGREVAIKIIRPELVNDTITRQRFLREAEVSAHLKHEHILPLIEFNEEQGRLFLVTPYIEGGTLSDRLQRGPIPLLEVRQLFVALVQAVSYIHKRGVIHRDLKPSNILLEHGHDDQVYVRLIDFGIARLQGDEANPQLTSDGIEIGTAEYMAPERLTGVAASSNDIYSLGVILYLMLAGRLPSIKPRASIPPALDKLVYRCMALNPADRFATADDLLKAFGQAYREFNNPLFQIMNPTALGVDVEDVPTARGDLVHDMMIARAVKSLQNTGEAGLRPIPDSPSQSGEQAIGSPSNGVPFRPVQATNFVKTDYDAPTTSLTRNIEVKSRSGALPAVKKPAGKRPRQTRKFSWLASFSVIIVLIILVIVWILALGIPSFATVQVNVRPQMRVVNEVFQIKANPASQQINAATLTIPAKAITLTRSSSLQGPTTGASCIIFCFNGRNKVVSATDVDTLTTQLKQNLDAQIAQDLQSQLRAKGAVSPANMPMQFTDLASTANPPVGTKSDTVTVSLTESGTTEEILNSDAQNLAEQLLTQQVASEGPNFGLVNSTVQLGQPVITNIDQNGVVSLKMAAAGVALYQFPSSQLSGIANHIKGLSVKDATNLLKGQQGVDSSGISIHFTMGGGDSLPSDASQIKITPVQPTNLPTIQLTPVPTVTLPNGQGTGQGTNQGEGQGNGNNG